MCDMLESNALKAEKEYTDKYVEITGYLDNIDSDGSYITVKAMDAGDWDFMRRIQCFLTSQEQEDVLLELFTGDLITVKGKISAVGEVLGYTLDIDSIEIGGSVESQDTTGTADNATDSTNDTATVDANASTPNKADEETVNQTSKEYSVESIAAMHEMLETNALKAEKTYNNKYIEVTGVLDVIDSDGSYITIKDQGAGEWDFGTDIQCKIMNDTQENQILEMSKGDTLTVRGKITSVGEIIGFMMEMDEIA